MTAALLRVKIRAVRYQYQCCPYSSSRPRKMRASRVAQPWSKEKNASLFGITVLSCPTAPPAVIAPKRGKCAVALAMNFAASTPLRRYRPPPRLVAQIGVHRVARLDQLPWLATV